MASLDIHAIPVYRDEFETAEDSWQTVAQIPASAFNASEKYALLVTCGVDSDGDDSSDIDGAIEVRVIHGATAFDDSAALLLPTRPTLAPKFYRHYGWMEIYTQGGTPDAIKLQIKRSTAGDDTHKVYAADVTLLALNLDNLVENTDYWVDENDDTGAPVTLSTANTTLIDRTFPDIGTAPYDGLVAFIFSSIRMNNTDVACQIQLDRTELNEAAGIINSVVLSRQTALHANERHAIMVPDGINVGDINDALFRIVAKDVGSPATHHEHMVTRVLYIRYAAADGSLDPKSGFENHLNLFTPATNTVGETPKHMMFGGVLFENGTYILSARGSVVTFEDELETTIFMSYNGPYPAYTETTALAGCWPTSFRHVVGDNAASGDITPQVRLAAKRYLDTSTAVRPVAFMDNGNFLATTVMTNFEVGYWRINTQLYLAEPELTLPGMQASGTATNTGPQDVGSGTIAVGGMNAAGTATVGFFMSATGSPALPGMNAAGTASSTLTGTTNTGTPELPGMAASGVAVTTIPAITATSAAVLPGMNAAGTATRTLAACPAFEYDQFGRQPIGVSQMFAYGARYPFVAPSADIQYLLADFYLAFDDPYDYGESTREFEPPFSIAWFFGYGCNPNGRPAFVTAAAFHSCDVIVTDKNGRIVFDSTAATHVASTWSNRLDVHEWTTASATCRAVVHTKWYTPTGQPVPQNYDIHIVPDNGTLDPRCVHRMPVRVRKLIIEDQELTGAVEFANGYNTEYTDDGAISDPVPLLAALGVTSVAAEGGRAGRRIGLAAVAGSGLGRSPGCDNLSLNILTVNNIQPDEYGNFIFNSEDCYWFEQPAERDGATVTMTPSTLMIHNDCVPCCTCDDYVAVKLGIDSLYARWLRIAEEAIRIREVYIANRDRWTADVACRLANQNQRLNLVTNCLGYVGVGYAFCTQSSECEGPLTVRFDVQINPAEGERPNPDPTGDTADPDSDGDGVDDSDETDVVTGSGPELLSNPQFSQGLTGWVTGGAVRNNSGGIIEMGFSGSAVDGTGNLLTNSTFAGAATGFTVTGNAAYTAVAFDYVRVGGATGGIGKLSQAAAVATGEVYTARAFYDKCVGTCRIKLIDSGGVETVQTLTPTSPGSEGNTSIGDAVTATANGGTFTALVESEFAAVNYVHVNKMWLIPITGTLSQEVVGLSPGSEFTLTVNFLFNVVPFVVSFEDADGNELFSETVSLSGFAHTFTKLFTPGTTSGTVKVRVRSDLVSGIGQITAMSLKQNVVAAPDGGGGSDGGDAEIVSQYAMRASYVPNTARKNDVSSSRMQPYTMGGAFPTLTAEWDRLNPGKAGRLTFMCFICNGIDGDSVTVTATPTLNGEELESISETIALTPACPTEQELCGE